MRSVGVGVFAAILLGTLFINTVFSAGADRVSRKIEPRLHSVIDTSERITAIVVLRNQHSQQVVKRAKVEFEPKIERSAQRVRGFRDRIDLSRGDRQTKLALVNKIEDLSNAFRKQVGSQLKARNKPDQDMVARLCKRLGGEVIYRHVASNALTLRLSANRLPELAKDPLIVSISEDRKLTSQLASSTFTMGTQKFWNAGLDGGPYDVGIIDTGIRTSHDAFNPPAITTAVFLEGARQALGGYPDDSTISDVNGHGTHVSGIVGGNSGPARGVAFGIDNIVHAKSSYDVNNVPGGPGAMEWSDAMAAVDWAVFDVPTSKIVDVFNFSHGSVTTLDYSNMSRFWDAVISDLGIPAAIIAGNEGPGSTSVTDPGLSYNAFTVANVDDHNNLARSDDSIYLSSSRGPTVLGRKKPDIAAPGTDIIAPGSGSDNSYETKTGTSMAAPHVAGALLLMLQEGVWDPKAQKAVLINAAQDKGSPGWDDSYGWGYINLEDAYDARDNYLLDHIDGPLFDRDDPTVTTMTTTKTYLRQMSSGSKCTIVWHRRVGYLGGDWDQVYGLSNLNLKLFELGTGQLIDASTSSIDNVEQVVSDRTANTKLVVELLGAVDGNDAREEYALACSAGSERILIQHLHPDVPRHFMVPDTEELLAMPVRLTNANPKRAEKVRITLSGAPGLDIRGTNPRDLGPIESGDTTDLSWEIGASTAGDYSLELITEIEVGTQTASATDTIQITAAPDIAASNIDGTKGGALISSDGQIRVDFPAQSYAGTFGVAVRPETPPETGPPGRVARTNIYRLSPAGFEFEGNREATLTIGYPAGADPQAIDIYSYDGASGWQNVARNRTVDESNRTISVTVAHFSYYGGFSLGTPATGNNSAAWLVMALIAMVAGVAIISFAPGR